GDRRKPVQRGSRVEAAIQPTSHNTHKPPITTRTSPSTKQQQSRQIQARNNIPCVTRWPRGPGVSNGHTHTDRRRRPTLHTAGPSFRGHRLRDAVKEVVPVKR
ncbi:unnamed protein product, partial [Ectocarpus sp. 13 AM-2016]